MCRQSLVEHLDADVIIAATAQGFDVFEKHFAFPYPFGKYDQVFVPEYNGGAMENIGAVTFRDEYIFRSRVTAATSDFRRGTILHELSHMWFGNLVTMKWWDDLWLKESFATWASNFAISQVDEDPSLPWAAFRSGSKTTAYRQDQLPSTHPVSADIVDLEALEYNFDQITYAKGASVLVQLVSFVGEETFLAGVRSYFADHAYGNTTLADLLAALEKVSGLDLADWSAQWLETAGVNTLQLELEVDADDVITSAVLLQSAPAQWPTLRRHRLALGLYDDVDGALHRVDRIDCDISEAAYAAARPGRSGSARRPGDQRRRPDLRQDHLGPSLGRHRSQLPGEHPLGADPRGALGGPVGRLSRRPAAGRAVRRGGAACGAARDRADRGQQRARPGRDRHRQLCPAGAPTRPA